MILYLIPDRDPNTIENITSKLGSVGIELLGWSPKISFEAGLKRYVEWMEKLHL